MKAKHSNPKAASIRSPIAWTLARCAWAAMFIMHGLWFTRSFNSPTAWLGQQAALVAAIVFFAAKVIDLRALRIRLTRRSMVSCLVVAALLHTGAIDRAISDESLVAAAWALPVIVVMPACMALHRWGIVRRMAALAAAIGHVHLNWSRSFW